MAIPAFFTARFSRVAVPVLGLLLVGLIGFLIFSQYSSLVRLADSRQAQWVGEAEKRATAISYFFSERDNDLRSLEEAREISVYFENQALGMSLQYGLQASLDSARSTLERMLASRKLGKDPIYSRIALLGLNGEPIIQAGDKPAGPTASPEQTPQATTSVVSSGNTLFVVITRPYFFKGTPVATLRVWMPFGVLNSYFIGKPNAQQPLAIAEGDRILAPPANIRLPRERWSDIPLFLPDSDVHADPVRIGAFSVVRMPIPNTPLSILSFQFRQGPFDPNSPRNVLATTVLAAGLILVGLFMVIRLDLRNSVLQTRLEESVLRQREVGERNRLLEIEVTERKEAEVRLREARESAEAANVAKSEFLAVMSHELRTPLNGVLGFADLLLDTSLNDEQRDWAKIIHDSGTHLLCVVNDVLDFSSLEKDRLVLEYAPFAIADLVDSSCTPIRNAAFDKGLEFRSEIASGVPSTITGDQRRIRQILINLLGNAVKFTASGSVALHVSPAGGQQALEFAVADTGPGIAQEAQSILFDPFTQGDSTLRRNFEGSGLGLAIAQHLAGAMGGSLSVDSTLGKGSLFTFWLPLPPPPPADYSGRQAFAPA